MNQSIIEIIFSNFFKFDFIIFVTAGLNLFFLLKTRFYSRELYDFLNPSGWIPGGKKSLNAIAEKFYSHHSENGQQNIIRLRRRCSTFYSLFGNTTTLFPLLGLLGTVVSLIPMVNSMGNQSTGLFFSALTSTFWGIVFAIIFKAADGFIASGIDDNEKNVEIYLQEYVRNLSEEPEVPLKTKLQQSRDSAAYAHSFSVQAAAAAAPDPEPSCDSSAAAPDPEPSCDSSAAAPAPDPSRDSSTADKCASTPDKTAGYTQSSNEDFSSEEEP